MRPADYDAWLLDLDGTLVDTEWSYTREVFDRVGDRLGRRFTDREAELLWHGLGGVRNDYLRQWGVEPDAFWTAFHDQEDPEARAAATYLHEDATFVGDLDVPVGVVTHSQPFLAGPVIEALDIGDWFDVVISCSDEVGWKPDPAPVELALDRLGLDPTGTNGVLAGDAASDVGAAWNAGLDAVHVERHGHEHRGHCVLGDYRVASFDALFSTVAAD
ncbi:MAG: HAD family hydrolase [Halanaeroarchaeum sp.]